MRPRTRVVNQMLCALIVLGGCSHRLGSPALPPVDSLAPRGDHLEHVVSRDDSLYFHLHRLSSPVRTAMDLIAALDSANVGKAIVASFAYFPGAPDAVPDSTRDEYTRVRDENDWVAAQVAQYPIRLVGFCAVNPLREYALREIARCKTVGLPGLKLHLANARMDFSNPADVGKVRAAFAAANAERLPIIVHLRGVSPTYGTRDARTFIENILPAAPDVPVQLAHMAGWGGYDAANDDALAAFIAAMKSGEVDRSRLYFDLGAVFPVVRGGVMWTPVITRRMREIGLDQILFATDGSSHRALVSFLLNESGLTRDEVRRVFDNLAPYLN
jgi:predicted TIM-barrel fold metal-dependent hydrolase